MFDSVIKTCRISYDIINAGLAALPGSEFVSMFTQPCKISIRSKHRLSFSGIFSYLVRPRHVFFRNYRRNLAGAYSHAGKERAFFFNLLFASDYVSADKIEIYAVCPAGILPAMLIKVIPSGKIFFKFG